MIGQTDKEDVEGAADFAGPSIKTSFGLLDSKVQLVRLGNWKEHKVHASIELIFINLLLFETP